MTGWLPIDHQHEPVYRVVRLGWTDPLDASFSQSRPDNRWNTAEFPVLYCACSELAARAVALDVFRLAGVELADLRPAFRPQLVEIAWRGRVVDVVSPEGVRTAGFPSVYPAGVSKEATRQAAAVWHKDGAAGVVCRSASVFRQGLRQWLGAHERWGELAIFPGNAAVAPVMLRRREDPDWLRLAPAGQTEVPPRGPPLPRLPPFRRRP
jgi:RES domain